MIIIKKKKNLSPPTLIYEYDNVRKSRNTYNNSNNNNGSGLLKLHVLMGFDNSGVRSVYPPTNNKPPNI